MINESKSESILLKENKDRLQMKYPLTIEYIEKKSYEKSQKETLQKIKKLIKKKKDWDSKCTNDMYQKGRKSMKEEILKDMGDKI